MEVKFKIIEVKEIIPKNNPTNKFKAFKTVDKSGKKMDVRFVRDCANVPAEPCTVVCDDSQCNVDTRRQYPVLWIKNVIRVEPLERKSNVSDFFNADPDSGEVTDI